MLQEKTARDLWIENREVNCLIHILNSVMWVYYNALYSVHLQ